MNENQKKVTDEYRDSWDKIFGDKAEARTDKVEEEQTMSWNHRAIRFRDGEETWLEICECYYDAGGEMTAHTRKGVSVTSDTVDGLRWTLQQMLKGLDKPVVDEMEDEEGGEE